MFVCSNKEIEFANIIRVKCKACPLGQQLVPGEFLKKQEKLLQNIQMRITIFKPVNKKITGQASVEKTTHQFYSGLSKVIKHRKRKS